jgi:prepilin-type N-terminal cleavage/methylation domain-containing protein
MHVMMRREEIASAGADAGFTLVELMVVVLIIGILVAICIPVFQGLLARAQVRSCFANQRSIVGAVATWRVDSSYSVSTLSGIVNMGNPLMNPLYLLRPPRCPSAPSAVSKDYPTVAEGAYSLDSSGNVLPCGLHGAFQ